MRKELDRPTPSLAGATELVVLAPLRQGLVPSLEALGYASRTRQLLGLLHAGRRTSHEYQLFRALSDAVERVGVIHTLRVAVLEPQGQVLLSVNFDGAYEAYVRVIWQKASRLLDLIFCNTEGYPLGWRSPYAVWRDWLRSVQVETPFFYNLPGSTYQDAQYLRTHEYRQRRDGNDDALARLAGPSAERIAWDIVLESADPSSGAPGPLHEGRRGLEQGIRQGLQGLAAVHRLAEVYPPGTADGQVLLDAAHELLPEFSRLQDDYADSIDRAGSRLRQQLAWFRQPRPLPPSRIAPPLQVDPVLPLANVQGGVLQPYEHVSHACLCLLAFDGPAAAHALLAQLLPQITLGDTPVDAGAVTVNLGLSAEGLRACGLDEPQLDWLPPEFRQGMEARAGLLGDLRHNHPRRWALPLRNWPQALDDPAWQAPDGTPRVATQAVHAVLQLRWVAGAGMARHAEGPQALARMAHALLDDLPGVAPLSVQWLARTDAQGATIDHFGFTDGQSQPVYRRADGGRLFRNQVHPGEVLLGHANAADAAADLPENQHAERGALLVDGSFLVLRKLRQNVGVLRQAVDAATAGALAREEVLAKMMGRWPLGHAKAGQPLIDPLHGRPNDFDYGGDADGGTCPLSAHIRLANPRETPQTHPTSNKVLASIPGGRPPRIVRRSMPYGPAAPAWPAPGDAVPHDDGADRGLLFIAYNASIGEQFEVVQRWLSGGNSSGMVSAHADPFLGVSRSGRQRMFRFIDERGAVVRMALDGSDALDDEPTPVVALQWGLYLFSPARTGLQWLHRRAQAAAAVAPPVPWSAPAGEREILRLQGVAHAQGDAAAADAWKLALEDLDAVDKWRSASIWAAVRAFHGGALRTPHGVLVASGRLVDDVLRNAQGRYTVHGYQQRLQDSIGPIYLGMDDGPNYQRESAACNDAITALTFEEGFNLAHAAARTAIDGWIADAVELAEENEESRWELLLDAHLLIDAVLAKAAEDWFGLQEGRHFVRGAFDWQPLDPATGLPDPRPRYPGFFTAVSRATFQPAPGLDAQQLSRSHGQALRTAMNHLLRDTGAGATAPVARAVLDTSAGDTDLAARTLVGALMGMLPTTAGCLRRILFEWLRDGTLWQLHAQHAAAPGWAQPNTAMQWLHKPLLRTLQARPVPEQIWRTARDAHTLQDGAEPACEVRAGDRIVLGLVSATQQALQAGHADVMPVFGGERGAPGSPTHACPGYRVAMGVIVGAIAAVLQRRETLRPGPAGAVLAFEGPLAPPDPAPERVVFSARWMRALQQQGSLLACGDSWIYNAMPATRRSLGEALADQGWDTSTFSRLAAHGRTLRELALQSDDPDPGTIYRAILEALRDAASGKPLPRAILVSAGGNDVHKPADHPQPPLFHMLNNAADVASGAPLFTAEKNNFVRNRLGGDMRLLLHKLTRATEGRIPIVVLGYDHPIPDGRKNRYTLRPWLKPWITGAHGHDAKTTGRQIMRTLIDELNEEYGLAARQFAGSNVHHVPLTGVLAAQDGYDDDHTRWWGDELHPTEPGFAALARHLQSNLP